MATETAFPGLGALSRRSSPARYLHSLRTCRDTAQDPLDRLLCRRKLPHQTFTATFFGESHGQVKQVGSTDAALATGRDPMYHHLVSLDPRIHCFWWVRPSGGVALLVWRPVACGLGASRSSLYLPRSASAPSPSPGAGTRTLPVVHRPMPLLDRAWTRQRNLLTGCSADVIYEMLGSGPFFGECYAKVRSTGSTACCGDAGDDILCRVHLSPYSSMHYLGGLRPCAAYLLL